VSALFRVGAHDPAAERGHHGNSSERVDALLPGLVDESSGIYHILLGPQLYKIILEWVEISPF
jgi:hypothetical protein